MFSLYSLANPQYIHTTGHTYTRLTFVVSLVNNEFSSKYYCVGLITVTNSTLNYHRHTNSNRNGTPVGFQDLTTPAK